MKNYLILFIMLMLQRSNAQIPTVQDCMGAIQIYDSVIVVTSSFSGTGNYPNEINPATSCLNQGEKNSVWFYFDVCNSGLFGFSIIPNGMDDYDWNVYDLTNATCADIFGNPGLELSCNFSGITGTTGPNGLPGATNNPLLNLIAGQHILISVNNFSSSQNGFEIHLINPSVKCNGGLIQGKVFLDLDSNCVQTNGEKSLKKQLVHLNPAGVYGFTNSVGNYNFQVNPGTYNVSLLVPLYSNVLCPITNNYSLTINSTADSLLNNDFAQTTPDSIFDLKGNLGSFNTIRLNSARIIYLDILNKGTSAQSALVNFKFDSLINFISSSLPVDSIVNKDIWWHFDTIATFESKQIAIQVFCPLNVLSGTILEFTSNVFSANADTFPSDNTDTILMTAVYSYDPNEIVVSPVGNGTQHVINSNQQLTYHINFQNTGNSYAQHVMIDNPVNTNLDLSTIDLITSSHNYEIKLLNNNTLRFNFYNINLPDSTNDEPGSHGFVEYSIYPKLTVFPGAVINNSASIYFDQNAPVATNTVFNTIINPISISENSNSGLLTVFPNPASDNIYISFAEQHSGNITLELFDLSGRKILMENRVFKNKMELSTENIGSGVYELKITTGDSQFSKRIAIIKAQ